MATQSLFGNNTTTVDFMNYPDTVDGAVNETLRIKIHIDYKGTSDARVSIVFLDVPFALRDWKVAYGTFDTRLSVKHDSYVKTWNGGSTQLLDYDPTWWTKVECQVLRYMSSQLTPPSKNQQPQQQQQRQQTAAQQPAPQQRPKMAFDAAAFNQRNGNPVEEPELTPADIVG